LKGINRPNNTAYAMKNIDFFKSNSKNQVASLGKVI